MRLFALAWLVCLAAAPAQARAESTLVELSLEGEPHPPKGAPDALVVVPETLDATQPIDVVVFLHGFSCCVRALVHEGPTSCRAGEPARQGWGLHALHRASKSRALLVVPQLAYLARSSKAERYARPGGFDALIRAALARASPTQHTPRAGRVALVAHSAGYAAMASIVRDRSRVTDVHALVLLDALYAHAELFARFVREADHRRFVSLYTPQTARGSRNILRELSALDPATSTEPSLEARVAQHRVLIAPVKTAHGRIPHTHLVALLRGLERTKSAAEDRPSSP